MMTRYACALLVEMISRIKELVLLTFEFFATLRQMKKDGDFIPYDKVKRR
jgi:hypothetical protein